MKRQYPSMPSKLTSGTQDWYSMQLGTPKGVKLTPSGLLKMSPAQNDVL